MNPELARTRSPERTRKFRNWAIIIVTNLLSLICLVWALSGADLGQISGDVRDIRWHWVVIALASDGCVYLLHGWRWKLLLRPIERVRFWHCVEAIYVGLFANEVIPLRAGELIRCFLLSKSTDIPLSVTFASALIERIFDGIWLMACFFVSLHLEAGIPSVMRNGGYLLGGLIIFCAALIGLAMYAKQAALDEFFGWSWPHWFNTLIADLQLIGHSRYLYYSFLVSGMYLLAQMLPIYCMVRATDLDVPWVASFTMMVLLRLVSIVPQAPGNLGSFQLVAAQSLILFNLEASLAKRFSLILWAAVTLPLIVIGAVALAITGISMTHLHKQASAAAGKRR